MVLEWLKQFNTVAKEIKQARINALDLARLDKEARRKPIGLAEDFDLERLEAMLKSRKSNERLEIYFQNGTRAVISTANNGDEPLRREIW